MTTPKAFQSATASVQTKHV